MAAIVVPDRDSRNTEKEQQLCEARGLEAVFVNHNAFVDERVFRPNRDSQAIRRDLRRATLPSKPIGSLPMSQASA